VSFCDVAQIYLTPCAWADKPIIDPGRDIDALAAALADRPLRNATAPTDVVLGGLRGKYLEWSAQYLPEATDQDRAELAEVVASIRFLE
jgi:hypothetical protein